MAQNETNGVGEKTPPRPKKQSSNLDRAYDKLDTLLARRHVNRSSAGLEAQIDAAWARLDKLQDAETKRLLGIMRSAPDDPFNALEKNVQEGMKALKALTGDER